MTDQQSVNSENIQMSTDGLGALLRAARQEKNITQQDVSNSLRYSVKQIDALENNAFEALPDPMMTRGFIRSYAKYLEIDAEPLLAIYRANLGEDTQKVIAVKSSMRPVALTKESLPWLKYILATIVVLLFLLAWMLYVEFMPKQGPDASAETATGLQQSTSEYAETTAAANVESIPEAALPAAERATEADVNAAISDITTTQVPEPTPVSVTADAATVENNSSTPVVPATQAMNNKTIALSFSGQSWVSITDKTGKIVYEKLSQSGAQETVSASPPLTVIIGSASDTKMQYSGQAVDLAPHTKNNVARITLE